MAQSVPQYEVIDDALSGDNTIVAAVAGKKIRVLAFLMVASGGAVTARWESDTGGTALTGQMALAANAIQEASFNPAGWFETVAGELLNLELSGAVSVDGALVYTLVD